MGGGIELELSGTLMLGCEEDNGAMINCLLRRKYSGVDLGSMD